MGYKISICSNKTEQENEEKLSVLMMEYNNLHDKVKWVIQSCSTKAIQALISLGVVFAFCINGYNKSSISFFVDVSMCVLIPILSLGIICISLSTNIQVLAFGEYLVTIEKRINKICFGKKKVPESEKIMNWESWRIEYGVARDKVVYYDSAFLYVTAFFVGVVSPIVRILHMNKMTDVYSEGYMICWIGMISLVISLMTSLMMVLINKTIYSKKRIDELLSTGDIVFGEKRNAKKTNIIKLILTIMLVYVIVLCLFWFIVKYN